MEMNSRRPDKRQFQRQFNRPNNNYSGPARFSNKRKYDADESEPPNKKFYARYSYDPAPSSVPYTPQPIWRFQERSSEPEQQPVRNRANDRIKRIRQNQSADLIKDKKQEGPATNINNLQVRFSTSPSEKQPLVVTSVPSSTQSRVRRPSNDSAKTDSIKSEKSFTDTRRDESDARAMPGNGDFDERPVIAKPSSLSERLANRKTHEEPLRVNTAQYLSRDTEHGRKVPAVQDYHGDRDRTFMVTARPKSLDERLQLIRSNNTQSRGFPKSSMATAIRNENASNWRVLQNKFADYNKPEQTRQRKASMNSLQNSVKSGFSVAEDITRQRKVSANSLQNSVKSGFSVAEDITRQRKVSTNSLQNSANSVSSGGEDVPAAMYSNVQMTNYPTPGMMSGSSKTAEDTFMDWSYIEEREVLCNLQELRADGTVNHKAEPQTPFQAVVAKGLEEMPQNKTILQDIYVVVDTNIFISHLKIVHDLLDVKVNGVVSPIVLIPWMVIQELDHIKDGRSQNTLKNKAQTAIHFISDHLLCKNSHLKGQSIRDAAQQDFSSKSADDGILYCCMQVLDRRNRPMLLTNDVNLRNKAAINGIDSYKHNEIIHALDPFRTAKSSNADHNRMKEMEAPLSQLLGEIILFYLEDGFGAAAWSKMRCSIKSPPWSLKDCLELIQKYWKSVFALNLLQNHSLSKVVDLDEFLRKHSGGHTTKEDLERFVDLSLALCLFFKNDLSKYEARFNQCINQIQSVLTKP